MPKPPNWSDTVALFGGRFDPPHLGHLEAIQGLFHNPGVKQVWILPSPTPPHKAAVASVEQRLEMARLGLLEPLKARSKGVLLDLREIERARRNPQSSTYTVDTLQEVRRDARNLAFVIGTDQLEQFHTWRRFPEILKLSHWIVLGRKPAGIDKGQGILKEWEASRLIQSTPQNGTWAIAGATTFLALVPTDAAELSSTRIREEIARTGEPPENSLEPHVLAYLKQNHLYGIERRAERR